MCRPSGLKLPDTHQEVWDISDSEWQTQHEGKKKCGPMNVFCSDAGVLDTAYKGEWQER